MKPIALVVEPDSDLATSFCDLLRLASFQIVVHAYHHDFWQAVPHLRLHPTLLIYSLAHQPALHLQLLKQLSSDYFAWCTTRIIVTSTQNRLSLPTLPCHTQQLYYLRLPFDIQEFLLVSQNSLDRSGTLTVH